MSERAMIYIVDDNQHLLEALQQLFATVEIPCKTFSSARDFLDQWSKQDCGCLLVDMRMPGMSGIDLQAELKRRCIHLPVIFMSGHHNVESAVHAMKNGALEILQKPFDHNRLLEVVNNALGLAEAQYREREKKQQFVGRLATLTEREHEVMELMITGATNKEIGRALYLSPRTVETHRARVIQKLGVRSLAELVEVTVSLRIEPGVSTTF